jgi:hypothetical protein
MFMRRLSTLFLAVGLVFLVAHQAEAYRVKIGMRIMTDVFYAFQSGTSYGDGNVNQPDLTSFHVGVARASYMRYDFVSADKTTGARIQINIQAGPAHGASELVLHTMFGWYKFGRCMLAIGHRPNLFASLKYSPYQSLGFAGRDSIGRLAPWFKFIGFGKQFSGRFVQAALYYMKGPWTVMACVGQASTNNAVNAQFGGNANALVANTPAPRVDLAVEYKGKHFSVAPGAAFYYSRLEPMEGTIVDDQNVLSFMLVLPFHVNFGRFGFKGEVSFGQNWDTGNHHPLVRRFNRAVYWGGTNDDGNRIKVKDTRIYAACLGLYYRIGRMTLWLSGGWHRSENGSGDVAGGWRHGQQTRYAFVFAAPYRVNKHFTIAPEVGYWYQGWDPRFDVGGSRNPGRATSMTADLGSFWLAGIQFIIQF